MVHPHILRAMATPLLGYLDPEFLALLDDTQALMRQVFQTQNALTLPISGTGMAGMEAIVGNLVEPGDTALVCVAGFFGARLAEMVQRHGGTAIKLEKAWGAVFTPAEIDAALHQYSSIKLVALVHAETSTGALQPMEGLAEVAHRHGALLVMDCVTSLGGVNVALDDWGVDATYAGAQKCLGCPPGLAPVSVSDRARAVIRARKTKPDAWYYDLELLAKYYGPERLYHHTVSGTLIYAMREGLRLVVDEGLEARAARHWANAQALWDGLAELDLTPFVPLDHRLPTLTTVRVPEGVDEANVRLRLRDAYAIEIGAGLGPLKGQVWRIGLMGFSSRRENVTLLLGALREILREP
jgi:alanine-glyoxylate transaminase/serine-glyoxylate transaminase/serine-pyruvate transaminase